VAAGLVILGSDIGEWVGYKKTGREQAEKTGKGKGTGGRGADGFKINHSVVFISEQPNDGVVWSVAESTEWIKFGIKWMRRSETCVRHPLIAHGQIYLNLNQCHLKRKYGAK
jgi:hypothetical protein